MRTIATALPLTGVSVEDKSLIARAKAGDDRAFEALLRQFERPVLGLCTRLLGAGGEAEEAAQDVFWKFHRALSTFDEERRIEPWLFRIAFNECRDRLRRRRVHVELIDSPVPPAAEAALVLAEVREAVSRLPDRERAALLLREIEGLETREVAERLGTTEQTVRSQVSRARMRLRAWLGGAR
ncbi:MAG: sigma-70 family RNA polymerase sigma factor [Acidobacteria bacterium]|nr:sigma-70 family RNA polymerase sigma factor [Acidobacteriota bacterium]